MWDFRRLIVRQRSRRLIVAVHEAAESFPDGESFGLTSHLRRAANSVGTNIAEACGRPGARDRANFLACAIAGAEEVEHHLTIAADLGMIDQAIRRMLMTELGEIRRMLKALRTRSLREAATP